LTSGIGDDVRLTASVGIAIDRPGKNFDAWFARRRGALSREAGGA
jgi:hypothetical protein